MPPIPIEEDRVAFFEQGAASHAILPLPEFQTRYAGMGLQAAPKNKPLVDPNAKSAATTIIILSLAVAPTFRPPPAPRSRCGQLRAKVR